VRLCRIPNLTLGQRRKILPDEIHITRLAKFLPAHHPLTYGQLHIGAGAGSASIPERGVPSFPAVFIFKELYSQGIQQRL